MIINKTPHNVNIIVNGEIVKTFHPSGDIIRVEQEILPEDDIEGIPITRSIFGKVEDLPEFYPGTFYIVSQMVKNALPMRKDLLVPVETVRNEEGIIIGCRSLGI